MSRANMKNKQERTFNQQPTTNNQEPKKAQNTRHKTQNTMVRTSVFSIPNATPSSITNFHDLISSEIPKILNRWSLEVKIFKNNSQNISESSFLHEVAFDHETAKSVTIVNKSAIVTNLEIPRHLIDSASSNAINDNFDHVLQTKLQSLWLLRQTLKGENGNAYELQSGKFIVRTINVFVQGNLKAFLVVIEYRGKGDCNKETQRLIEELGLPTGKLSDGILNEEPNYVVDLAYQLAQALQ